MNPPEKIRFHPNRPVTVAVADPAGNRYNFETQQGEYQTTAGQLFTLPRPAVVALNALDLQPGEEIKVTHLVKAGQPSTWIVELAHSTEMARAQAAPEPPRAKPRTGKPMSPSPKKTQPTAPKRGPVPIRRLDQPSLFDRWNYPGSGTYGPAPARRPDPRPPEPIPWNIAFREVSAFVVAELKANHLQWSDQAQQAAVCTILIAESKKGRIGPWQRP
jgi:hypothetical protein